MLRLSDITLARGARVLLKGASLTVFPGHRVGLVGANGAGKSSVFAIAAREARAAEAHAARMEILKQKAAGKPGPKLVPDNPKAAPPPTSGANALEPDVPEEAVSLDAEPLPFKPRPERPKILPKKDVSLAPSAPYDQRAIPGDIAQIAEQIQQKSSLKGEQAMVQAELDKLSPGVRAQVEEILVEDRRTLRRSTRDRKG